MLDTYKKDNAKWGAFSRGRTAALQGAPKSSNPFRDEQVTYKKLWDAGFEEGKEALKLRGRKP
jgi:hypothetical protein